MSSEETQIRTVDVCRIVSINQGPTTVDFSTNPLLKRATIEYDFQGQVYQQEVYLFDDSLAVGQIFDLVEVDFPPAFRFIETDNLESYLTTSGINNGPITLISQDQPKGYMWPEISFAKDLPFLLNLREEPIGNIKLFQPFTEPFYPCEFDGKNLVEIGNGICAWPITYRKGSRRVPLLFHVPASESDISGTGAPLEDLKDFGNYKPDLNGFFVYPLGKAVKNHPNPVIRIEIDYLLIANQRDSHRSSRTRIGYRCAREVVKFIKDFSEKLNKSQALKGVMVAVDDEGNHVVISPWSNVIVYSDGKLYNELDIRARRAGGVPC